MQRHSISERLFHALNKSHIYQASISAVTRYCISNNVFRDVFAKMRDAKQKLDLYRLYNVQLLGNPDEAV